MASPTPGMQPEKKKHFGNTGIFGNEKHL